MTDTITRNTFCEMMNMNAERFNSLIVTQDAATEFLPLPNKNGDYSKEYCEKFVNYYEALSVFRVTERLNHAAHAINSCFRLEAAILNAEMNLYHRMNSTPAPKPGAWRSAHENHAAFVHRQAAAMRPHYGAVHKAIRKTLLIIARYPDNDYLQRRLPEIEYLKELAEHFKGRANSLCAKNAPAHYLEMLTAEGWIMPEVTHLPDGIVKEALTASGEGDGETELEYGYSAAAKAYPGDYTSAFFQGCRDRAELAREQLQLSRQQIGDFHRHLLGHQKSRVYEKEQLADVATEGMRNYKATHPRKPKDDAPPAAPAAPAAQAAPAKQPTGEPKPSRGQIVRARAYARRQAMEQVSIITDRLTRAVETIEAQAGTPTAANVITPKTWNKSLAQRAAVWLVKITGARL